MPKESASAPIFLDQKPTVRIHPEISDSEMTAQRERDLVLRSIAGCAESFGTWFEHYRPSLYRKAYFMTRNPEVAEDIISDVFVSSFRAMPRFKLTDAPPKSFLFRITHNQSINHLRSKKETSQLHDGIKDHKNSGFENHLIHGLDIEEQKQKILEAVSMLKDDQAEVIRMRFFEDMEYDEVAKVMGRTVAAVRVIQFRALAALRKNAGCLERVLTSDESCDSEGVA